MHTGKIFRNCFQSIVGCLNAVQSAQKQLEDGLSREQSQQPTQEINSSCQWKHGFKAAYDIQGSALKWPRNVKQALSLRWPTCRSWRLSAAVHGYGEQNLPSMILALAVPPIRSSCRIRLICFQSPDHIWSLLPDQPCLDLKARLIVRRPTKVPPQRRTSHSILARSVQSKCCFPQLAAPNWVSYWISDQIRKN